ncbi:ribose-5-phosphate isomerase-like isoform X2 [Dinothrombium tinctorium]|uniref:ribose-5-phosphate isomerase n=1 Tax=Dinothrombium tinctorium TaxID=1965070 RepID=A0A443QFM4_9ACAR|nr:ribose-5-phosphate isomerase-like isoform X2 [Dinothrombium tinctorium]
MNSNLEKAKKLCAFRAVDQIIEDNLVVGIGSGSTIIYGVQRLAERVKSENLKISCVPTSFQARQLIKEYNLTLTDLESNPELDVAIDGADEVDENFVLIKGGGGCLTQEKIIASAAKNFIVIADYRKNSKYLGQNWHTGIPIEVIPFAYVAVSRKIELLYGGKCTVRTSSGKAGPLLTDNSNFIIDWKFPVREQGYDWKRLNEEITLIPGVVETGLFVDITSKVYFGNEDGTITIKPE